MSNEDLVSNSSPSSEPATTTTGKVAAVATAVIALPVYAVASTVESLMRRDTKSETSDEAFFKVVETAAKAGDYVQQHPVKSAFKAAEVAHAVHQHQQNRELRKEVHALTQRVDNNRSRDKVR